MTLPRFSKKRQAEIASGLRTANGALKGKPVKGFSTKRKPTGEIATLDRLIAERGPYSEISGDPIISKGHDRYHWQIFHILGKGEYPELRLYDENLLICTPDEQAAWTNHKYLLKNRPEWAHVFAKEAALKLAARTK
jgi:hypothetical protein